MVRKPVVTVFVRHSGACPHEGKPFFRGCTCVKWLRYSGPACLCGHQHQGKQHRFSAETRTWGLAEEKAQELQRRLDAGETGAPLPATTEAKHATIQQALETFITAKEGEGVSASTIRKLRYQLGQFNEFMEKRNKFFPAETTATDVIDFRAGWTWKSGVTKQKAQQNLRGFLRSCCKENLPDLLGALKTIRLSKADKSRLEPQPFTEKELKHLLAQVPKTFPDSETAKRMTALIHCMVATGLAIRDTVQLERASLKDGWLRINRQKTGKAVRQKIDGALCAELLAVANGNPKFIFWNGKSEATSAVGLWQRDLRTLMGDAGLWIKGNLSHRFRDTAVDFWLGAGCSLTDIAAMLGDTVAIVERHYANLASKRMEDRLAKIPARSWQKTGVPAIDRVIDDLNRDERIIKDHSESVEALVSINKQLAKKPARST
jgi:integrase